MSSKLLTEVETADICRVSVSSLRCQRVTGKGIVFVKMGGRVLYREQDIETYINKRTFKSTTEYQQSLG